MEELNVNGVNEEEKVEEVKESKLKALKDKVGNVKLGQCAKAVGKAALLIGGGIALFALGKKAGAGSDDETYTSEEAAATFEGSDEDSAE